VARSQGIFRPTYTKPGPDGARVRRTSKKWAYRFEYEGGTYQKAGFATAGDAERARDVRRAELRAGQETDWRKVTLEAAHRHASALRVSWRPASVRMFDEAWRRIFRYFPPGERLASIDDTRLLEFVEQRRRDGARTNTIKIDLAKLKVAMRLAHAKRLLPWVPRFPKLKDEHRQQVVAAVELRQIVAEMPAEWRAFFAAAEEMGWRARSELRTRRWSDVDLGPARWTCCARELAADSCACGTGRPGWVGLDAASSKNGQPRRFPMTLRLRAILADARAWSDRVRLKTGTFAEWVFVDEAGRQLGNYRKPWEAALKALGIGKLPGRTGPWSSARVVHDIRRAAVRRMRLDGLDRETRKALVGHESDAAHAWYEPDAYDDVEALRAAAVRLDQERAEAPPENVVQLSLFRRG
jgi:hypothetical protein